MTYWDLLYRPPTPPSGWWEVRTTKTITTDNTGPLPAPTVDEDAVRKIVRQELADIMPIDVPDAPPEGL